ncbi:hypothetical protein [Aggregatilinea lenta]|nr:hypothetical protein [Aggregatilinea lenta]
MKQIGNIHEKRMKLAAAMGVLAGAVASNVDFSAQKIQIGFLSRIDW